ncbi:hypothetical protein [Planococcus sp. 107-1]|uniref:hypothetical protein n=1 Tax=Planococcus sp. 107-1 TaxID=2908840 RepID=UPI001F38F879|nr:hypothetical protein [Planococcus sp. 107-1]UJF27529.1 hypothetical protein L0M13_03355 [Planococcus sp. 107-1]
MELLMMGTILGLGFLFLIGFEMNKKAKVKLAEIELKRDQVALEKRKLELGLRSDT